MTFLGVLKQGKLTSPEFPQSTATGNPFLKIFPHDPFHPSQFLLFVPSLLPQPHPLLGSALSCWRRVLPRSRVWFPAWGGLWSPPLPGPSHVWEGWSRACRTPRRLQSAHTRPRCWRRQKERNRSEGYKRWNRVLYSTQIFAAKMHANLALQGKIDTHQTSFCESSANTFIFIYIF